MGKKFKFRHVDVFSEKMFGGNQLAVFTDAKGLNKKEMQELAREMNFSETAFVMPSRDRDVDAHVRIFTPWEEIPFAGHPVIGTAFVLVESSNRKRKKKVEGVTLKLGSGNVRIDVEYAKKKPPYFVMHQPIPEFGVAIQDRGQAAMAVGLDKENVVGGGVVSNGLDFLVMEIDALEHVRKAQLNVDMAVKVSRRYGVCGIYIFSRYERGKFDIHSRFFAPSLGVYEDAATGSASGAVGGYLARILKFPIELKVRIEQGVEIHRPSSIYVDVKCERGVISDVRVGGYVVPVAEGVVEML